MSKSTAETSKRNPFIQDGAIVGTLTLRDLVAIVAMHGILTTRSSGLAASVRAEEVADRSYQYADAMLKIR